MKRLLFTALILLLSLSLFAISAQEAKDIALKAADAREDQVTGLWVKPDYEDGLRIFEVDFRVGNKAYEYDISAADGSILSSEHEIRGEWKSGEVGKEEALEIALRDAGYTTSKEVKSLKTRKTRENGLPIWRVTFQDALYKYEYDISSSYGFVEKEYELRRDPASNRSGSVMSQSEAERIFLTLFPAESGNELRIEKDYDDGLYTYEASYYASGYEYDAEIDAVTGQVISFSIER